MDKEQTKLIQFEREHVHDFTILAGLIRDWLLTHQAESTSTPAVYNEAAWQERLDAYVKAWGEIAEDRYTVEGPPAKTMTALHDFIDDFERFWF